MSSRPQPLALIKCAKGVPSRLGCSLAIPASYRRPMRRVLLLSAKRTPIGAFQGQLGSVPAPRLGATAIQAAVEAAKVSKDSVQEVFMGQVLSAGVGQAPARQATRFAGLPDAVASTTVSKVCGSGLQAVILASRAIGAGDIDCAVAGGMESMSLAPYLLPKARGGYRMGHGEVLDSMIIDGLWDPYDNQHMGKAGERCAAHYGFTREVQDAFARRSYERARAAAVSGAFAEELVAVEIAGRKATTRVQEDEEPGRADLEALAKLRPAFDPAGTITAANASSLNDGAAALVLVAEDRYESSMGEPLAVLTGAAAHAQAPEWFTTAPVSAARKLLDRLSLTPNDIDLWEVNEAFAAVTLAFEKELSVDPARVNICGGAVALGHPIGASGARILVTLLHALRREQKQRGLATLCIGGGEAVAVVVERV